MNTVEGWCNSKIRDSLIWQVGLCLQELHLQTSWISKAALTLWNNSLWETKQIPLQKLFAWLVQPLKPFLTICSMHNFDFVNLYHEETLSRTWPEPHSPYSQDTQMSFTDVWLEILHMYNQICVRWWAVSYLPNCKHVHVNRYLHPISTSDFPSENNINTINQSDHMYQV